MCSIKFLHWVAFGIIVLIVFSGCEKKTPMSRVQHVQDNEPDQEFYNSRLVISENGITNAIVQAESIKVYMDSHFTSIKGGILIDFFSKEGVRNSTLTAQNGEVWGLYEEVDSLKAKGNVKIVSADKTKRMETSSYLIWISSSRKIIAPRDSLVKLISEDAVEQGINFVANDDLSEYRMDNVSGVFEGEDINLPGK